MKNTILLCLGLSLILFAGCNNKQKVSGHVTFPDGEAVPGGTLYFTSDSFMGRAAVRADGTFDVTSLKTNDGLPPGTYKVYLVGCYAADDGTVTDDSSPARTMKSTTHKGPNGEKLSDTVALEKPPTPLVHPRFWSAETTPLTFEVPGEKTFDFTVERFPENGK
ncbi:MAG: carboxypeptidase-like regulatory domain-containing protein [Planctomycetia bacterium]|nr:carboxypeptidase-like regulatory domain-containing protein [Planctomycetia bacterium]